MEWKFTRSKLYLEYIKSGGTLSVPFNIVPTWKDAFNLLLRFCSCCPKRAEEPEKDKGEIIEGDTIANSSAIEVSKIKVFSFYIAFKLYKCEVAYGSCSISLI